MSIKDLAKGITGPHEGIEDGLYKLPLSFTTNLGLPISSHAIICDNTIVNGALWRDKLVHPYHVIVEKVVSYLNCKIYPKRSYEVYGSCQLGKSYRVYINMS